MCIRYVMVRIFRFLDCYWFLPLHVNRQQLKFQFSINSNQLPLSLRNYIGLKSKVVNCVSLQLEPSPFYIVLYGHQNPSRLQFTFSNFPTRSKTQKVSPASRDKTNYNHYDECIE